MDDLTRIALVGTSKSVGAVLSKHPADALLDGHGSDPEETLLLRAGVRSLFDDSGRVPALDVTSVEAAPAEELTCGSTRLAGLLQNALATDARELLIEFLRQMQGCRLVLPHEILPQVLDVTDTDIREHVLPVLGERGRWLAGFQPDWAWVHSGTATLTGKDRDSLQRVWEHGAIRDRCSALATIRRADPAEGRSALEATFAQERAGHRARLLAACEHGLSTEDEPFLEACLDDRSTQVKEAAANLLVQLPESALSLRMRERADAMLSLTTKGRIRKRPKLLCEPPERIDKTWNRDGIASRPPSGRGKRAYWATVVLSAVPPSHWTDKFDLDPPALIAAIEDDSFEAAVLAAWSQAAARFSKVKPRGAEWLAPLWERGAARAGRMTGKGRAEAYGQLEAILSALPRDQAESLLLRELESASRSDGTEPLSLLPRLERPWSCEFAQKYLALTRKVLSAKSDNTGYQWANTLFTAARAIPREAFVDALRPWEVKDAKGSSWHMQSIVRETDRLAEAVNTRKTFYEELAAT